MRINPHRAAPAGPASQPASAAAAQAAQPSLHLQESSPIDQFRSSLADGVTVVDRKDHWVIVLPNQDSSYPEKELSLSPQVALDLMKLSQLYPFNDSATIIDMALFEIAQSLKTLDNYKSSLPENWNILRNNLLFALDQLSNRGSHLASETLCDANLSQGGRRFLFSTQEIKGQLVSASQALKLRVRSTHTNSIQDRLVRASQQKANQENEQMHKWINLILDLLGKPHGLCLVASIDAKHLLKRSFQMTHDLWLARVEMLEMAYRAVTANNLTQFPINALLDLLKNQVLGATRASSLLERRDLLFDFLKTVFEVCRQFAVQIERVETAKMTLEKGECTVDEAGRAIGLLPPFPHGPKPFAMKLLACQIEMSSKLATYTDLASMAVSFFINGSQKITLRLDSFMELLDIQHRALVKGQATLLEQLDLPTHISKFPKPLQRRLELIEMTFKHELTRDDSRRLAAFELFFHCLNATIENKFGNQYLMIFGRLCYYFNQLQFDRKKLQKIYESIFTAVEAHLESVENKLEELDNLIDNWQEGLGQAHRLIRYFDQFDLHFRNLFVNFQSADFSRTHIEMPSCDDELILKFEKLRARLQSEQKLRQVSDDLPVEDLKESESASSSQQERIVDNAAAAAAAVAGSNLNQPSLLVVRDAPSLDPASSDSGVDSIFSTLRPMSHNEYEELKAQIRNPRKALKWLRQRGFVPERQRGSHLQMRHGRHRHTFSAHQASELKPGAIADMMRKRRSSSSS